MTAEAIRDVRIGDVSISRNDDRIQVTSVVEGLGAPFPLYFSTANNTLARSLGSWSCGDAFVIAVLPIALRLGLDISSRSPLSSRLMANLPTIMSIFAAWYDDFTPVTVHAATIELPAPANRGIAGFFSGGVDSFFSAIDRHADLTHLVAVHGFDVPVSNRPLWNVIAPRLSLASDALDRPLLLVETNLRELSNRFVSWPLHQFGAGLAAVATLLAPIAHRVLIPASESFRHLNPCGSHPILDPLWSTEAVEIEHHGAAFNRNQKIAAIANSETALHHLRVCWENPGNLFNCGRCEKCVRTMLGLVVAGAEDRCRSFPDRVTSDLVRATRIPLDLVLFHAEANLSALRKAGHDQLGQALAEVIARYRAERLGQEVRALPASGWIRLLRTLLRRSSR